MMLQRKTHNENPDLHKEEDENYGSDEKEESSENYGFGEEEDDVQRKTMRERGR